MKSIISIILSLSLASLTMAEKSNVLTSLNRKTTLKTEKEVANWKFNKMSFKIWLAAVAKPEWKLLTSTQTEDFYFAVFRSGNILIFWNLDRKAQYNSSSIGTTPKFILPSKVVTLDYEVKSPSGGGLTYSAVGSAFEIKEDHKGLVEIRFSAGTDNKRNQVFQANIPWTLKSEK